MANKIEIHKGTPIVWADVDGDFGDSPIPGTDQITLAGIVDDQAREGVKVDLGDPRAEVYEVILRIEFATAPGNSSLVKLYFAPSPSVVAGTANPGGVSGTDGAYTGTPGSAILQAVKQLDYVGSLVCTADAQPVVQQQTWKYSPAAQYISPVVINNSGGPAFYSDDVEMSIILIPLPVELQDAP